jgi:hypothetical protein
MRYLGIFIAALALVFLFSQFAPLKPAVISEASIKLEILSAENADELQQIARYGNGALSGAIAWSSETETVAAGTSLGIWFYSPSRSDDTRFLDLDTKVFDLVFLNAGRFLAYTTTSATKVIELATGLEVMSFPEIHVISAHPNDDYLLIDSNVDIEVWDIVNQELLQTVSLPQEEAYGYVHIVDIAISPDERYFAASYSGPVEDTCGHRTSYVLVWDTTKLNAEPFALMAAEYVTFSPDSRFLMSSEWNSWGPDVPALHILDLSSFTSQTFNTMPIEESTWGYVEWFSFEPLSGNLMTLKDGVLRFFDLATNEKTREIVLDEDTETIAVAKDGRAFSTRNDSISLWDNNFQQEELLPYEAPFVSANYFGSGDGLSKLDANQRLHLWRIDEHLQIREFFVSERLPESTYPFILSAAGDYLVYETDRAFELVSTVNNRLISEIPSSAVPTAFSADSGELLLRRSHAPSENQLLTYFQVWDIQSNNIMREFGPYQVDAASGILVNAQLNSDGSWIGIHQQLNYWHNRYTVFSITTGEEIYTYETETAIGAWSPDLRTLVMEGGDYLNAVVWTVAPLEETSEIDSVQYRSGGDMGVFSQDGSQFTFITSSHTGCGGDSRSLYTRSLSDRNGWSRGLPMGGWNTVDAIFNPAADLVFTIDSLVDVSTGDTLFQLPYGAYPSAAFSVDGRFFLTNQEGVIRLWGVPGSEN